MHSYVTISGLYVIWLEKTRIQLKFGDPTDHICHRNNSHQRVLLSTFSLYQFYYLTVFYSLSQLQC